MVLVWPRLTIVSTTIEANPSTLLGSAAARGSTLRNWLEVIPGSSRTKTGSPCRSPVTVDTIRTAPDWRSPPTVIFLPFIATVILGSEAPDAADGCAGAAAAVLAASTMLPGMASDNPTAIAAAVSVMDPLVFKFRRGMVLTAQSRDPHIDDAVGRWRGKG